MSNTITQRIYCLTKHLYLLKCLTEREIKSRYKGSILGLFWSFLNPVLYMAVLTIIFGFIVKIKIENYPLFILSGLLPWMFLSTSLSQSTNSIIANSSLINKVYLPKELFPFSLVLANLVNFIFSLSFFFILLLLFKLNLKLNVIVLFLPILLFFTTIFCAGICLLFSCLNVFFRDLSHLVGIILTLWFYASPVFYPIDMIPRRYLNLYFVNPMASIIHCYRELLIYGKVPELNYVVIAMLSSVVIFIFGYSIFVKYEDLFAELI